MHERFWSKVVCEAATGCWLWAAATNGGGYGVFQVRRRSLAIAPRLAWELTNGPIPPGLWVLHHCDVRLCVRPDHLYLGTARDNVRDMIARGRRKSDAGEANPQAKLTWASVGEARTRWAAGEGLSALARAFGVTPPTMHAVVHGHSWREPSM